MPSFSKRREQARERDYEECMELLRQMYALRQAISDRLDVGQFQLQQCRAELRRLEQRRAALEQELRDTQEPV
jgi:predicted nuclease with TOPRIM domain